MDAPFVGRKLSVDVRNVNLCHTVELVRSVRFIASDTD